jgi:hypothetical protein
MHLPKLKSTQSLPEYHVKSVNIKQLKKEDEEFPIPPRYGVFENKEINIKEEGNQIIIDSPKGKIWRYKICATDFYSMQLKFAKYYLPKNAKLFIYNEGYSEILGAYTSKNNNADSSLLISVMPDKNAIIEYYEPINTKHKGQLVLEGIVKIYKEFSTTQLTDDMHGFIGINCKEGKSWQDAKHATCMIRYIKDGSSYFCSGALINNVKLDGKPYFLTANHCIDETVNTSNILVSFNYEHSNCYGELHDQNQFTLSGAKFLTTGKESDFTLLLLNQTPPKKYQPFYAGWNASNSSFQSTVGIHHPSSKPKKISIDNDPPVSYPLAINWDEGIVSPPNSHWRIKFDKGSTFKGSSGSPVFENNGKIIGQLHGGDDMNYEYYGKLSYSWLNQDDGFNSLSHYLDPDNTGTLIINGAYSSSLRPDPQVDIDFQAVCLATPIQLSGFSAFTPSSWDWEFIPDNVSYHDGTSPKSQNPVVSFDTPGEYSIRLTVSNEKLLNNNTIGGDSTIHLNNFISAGTKPDIKVNPTTNFDSCLCRFNTLGLIARGAYNLTWSFSDVTKDSFNIVDKNANPITIKPSSFETPPKNYESIELLVSGEHGTCSSTIIYTFPFISQPNDNLINATQIYSGKNGQFSNKCASAETHEPMPPAHSCTAQDSWCDEYNTGESSVDNSVWFYYIAESDDNLTLQSTGFNNQLAIYLAESPADFENGNYVLVAANDNYSENQKDPVIENFNVQKGKKYWIQVDGSEKGKEGYFSLILNKYGVGFESLNTTQKKIRIYPQPATNKIFIDNYLQHNITKTNLKIYNLEGINIISTEYTNPTTPIDISSLKKGIYLLQITNNNGTYSGKFIK